MNKQWLRLVLLATLAFTMLSVGFIVTPRQAQAGASTGALVAETPPTNAHVSVCGSGYTGPGMLVQTISQIDCLYLSGVGSGAYYPGTISQVVAIDAGSYNVAALVTCAGSSYIKALSAGQYFFFTSGQTGNCSSVTITQLFLQYT